jgi:hypothetical protein
MENRVTESLLIASTMRSEHGRRTAREAKRWKHLRDFGRALDQVVLLRRETRSQAVRRETGEAIQHEV